MRPDRQQPDRATRAQAAPIGAYPFCKCGRGIPHWPKEFAWCPGGPVAAITAEQFQCWVEWNWPRMVIADSSPLAGLLVMVAGLAGETGEALEVIKKSVRDGLPMEGKQRRKLLLELGDALHYLTRIASHYGMTLPELMQANQEKIDRRHAKREASRQEHSNAR